MGADTHAISSSYGTHVDVTSNKASDVEHNCSETVTNIHQMTHYANAQSLEMLREFIRDGDVQTRLDSDHHALFEAVCAWVKMRQQVMYTWAQKH